MYHINWSASFLLQQKFTPNGDFAPKNGSSKPGADNTSPTKKNAPALQGKNPNPSRP